MTGVESPKAAAGRSANQENRPLPPVPPNDEIMVSESTGRANKNYPLLLIIYQWFKLIL